MNSNKRHACARITEEYHFGHQETYSETCVKDVYLGLLLCIDVIEHLYASVQESSQMQVAYFHRPSHPLFPNRIIMALLCNEKIPYTILNTCT